MARSCGNRIVVLIDMDCFFCQVETKLQPEHKGKPLAVVQYNQWELGGIIAVNYEAREFGVTRHMRADEAKEKCPDLVLASVPCLRGKADTSRYRTAGREVVDVIKKHCTIIERASVDEAYLDITDIVDKRISTESITPKEIMSHLGNTFIVGHSDVGKNDEEDRSKGMETWISNIFDELEDQQAQRLAIAGMIVEDLRADVYETTGYRCSAGISQNKILAKLACGLHKPNRQTILPPSAVSSLYSTLPVKKVRNLGGKFGDVVVESLNCNVMGDLLQYSLQYLQKRFDEKTGAWLYNIARGIDNEPVITRLVSKSIGACKKFPGKQAIVTLDLLKHWAGELSAEVCERLEQDLEENERRATLLTICYHYYQNRTTISQSRSCNLNSYKQEKMAERCVDVITKSTQCPVAYIGIQAGKFIPAKGAGNFVNFFKPSESKETPKSNSEPEYALEIMNLEDNSEQIKAHYLKIDNVTTRTITSDQIDELHTSANVPSDVALIENKKPSSVDILTSDNSKEAFNSKTGRSPTSMKVNDLIKSLTERTSKGTLYKNVVNKCLNDGLDQEKFKGSFFMNVFNSKEAEPNTEDHEKNTTCSMVEEQGDSYNCDINEVNINNVRDSTQRKLSTAQENTNGKLDNKISREERTKEESVICLQEIFPDLNNIDANVVALLPPDLQKEARLYMKTQNKNNTKVTEAAGKNSKGKSGKSKAANLGKAKKGSNMDSFLIKQNLKNVPLERCMECQQMIPAAKMEEHKDFHVAQNLQNELNLLPSTGVKRRSTDSEESSSKRRSVTDVTSKTFQPITTFLS